MPLPPATRLVVFLSFLNILSSIPIIVLSALVINDVGKYTHYSRYNFKTGGNIVLLVAGCVILAASLTCLYRVGRQNFFTREGDKFTSAEDQAESVERWTNISSIATLLASILTVVAFIVAFALQYSNSGVEITPEKWFCEVSYRYYDSDSYRRDRLDRTCGIAQAARWIIIPAVFAILPLAALSISHWKRNRTSLSNRVAPGKEADQQQQQA